MPAAYALAGYTFVGWTTEEYTANTAAPTTIYKTNDEYEVNEDTTFFALYSYILGSNNFTKVTDASKLAAGKEIDISAACDYLSQVGLCARDYINREVNASLSGGELKRIEIATVLARGSKVSLFDEPEAGIDLWSFGNLINVFEKLHETNGGSIIIISHQERILNIADKVAVIAAGELTAYGEKENILPELLGVTTSACSVLTENLKEAE